LPLYVRNKVALKEHERKKKALEFRRVKSNSKFAACTSNPKAGGD
jgi:hypothetical protein